MNTAAVLIYLIEKKEKYLPLFLEKCRTIIDKIKKLRVTTLDVFIIKQFVSSFAVSLFFFVAIYIMVQVFQRSKWLPPDSNPVLVFQYYFYMGVYWLYQFQPFAFLFASVYGLSRMAQFKELIAVVSTGTSLYRISIFPVLITSAYLILLIGYLQNIFIFPAYQKYNILEQIVFHKEDPKGIEGLKDNRDFSVFGANNLIYIVGFYNAITKEMFNITVIKLKSQAASRDETSKEFISNQNVWLLTNAEELTKERSLVYPEKIDITMRIDCDKASWNQESKRWIFHQGVEREVENSGESFKSMKITNQSYDFIADPPYYFERIWYDIDAMSYNEGLKYLDKLKRSKQDSKEAETRFLSRFTYPLGIIFIVLAGIGVIDLSRRKISFIVNLMVSMSIFIVYYIFFAVGISLAGKGNVSPYIGASIGTVFLMVISIYTYMRAKT
ncbi:MAG: LptF/LptG family permease [Brevinematales bacterium]|jgi:lipopolysaccharide export LptBFGC system permease protein LptF